MHTDDLETVGDLVEKSSTLPNAVTVGDCTGSVCDLKGMDKGLPLESTLEFAM